MSYLGPSPRPPGFRGPPRHSGPTHAARWQAAYGPAQAGLADRFAAARMPPSTGRQPANTRRQPTSTRRQTHQCSQATHQCSQATHRHSATASTQGNRAALAATGRVLSGLGPGFVIFIFLLARRQAWGLPRSRGSRPGRPGDCGSSHYQYWVDLTVDRAGLKTQESRRRGHQRAGAKAGARALFAGNPPCTIAIRPWRQTGSRHHSGPITAARGA
jgi:hypothetical protein